MTVTEKESEDILRERVDAEIDKRTRFIKDLALEIYLKKNSERFKNEYFDYPDYCGINPEIARMLGSDHVDVIQESQDIIHEYSPEDIVNLLMYCI